jgi:hypothetical protein
MYQDLLVEGIKPWANLYVNSVQLQEGAQNGYILTSDSEGNAMWEPGSGSGDVNSVTAGDGTIAIGGTSANPTVEATGAFGSKNITTTGKITTGTFELKTSPTSGYVLTSDGSGNGTWQAAGGAVSSVTAADGTMAITPTTGSVTAAATGAFGSKAISTNAAFSCDAHQIASDGNGNFYIGNSGTMSDAPIQLFGTTGAGTSAGNINMTGALNVGRGLQTGTGADGDGCSFDNGDINTDGQGNIKMLGHIQAIPQDGLAAFICPTGANSPGISWVTDNEVPYDSPVISWTSNTSGTPFSMDQLIQVDDIMTPAGFLVASSRTTATATSGVVTCNGSSGIITTVSLTAVAGGFETLTINNAYYTVGQVIQITTQYDGTQGNVFTNISSTTNGQIILALQNVGLTTLNAPANIHFSIN